MKKSRRAPEPATSPSAHIKKTRIMAAVEPWHGNEVVVYTQNKGAWQRKVIFSDLKEGHEVCVGDFNGDGRDDIVAGDRAKGAKFQAPTSSTPRTIRAPSGATRSSTRWECPPPGARSSTSTATAAPTSS